MLVAVTLPAASAPTTSVDINVAGLRSAKGMVRLCMTTDPASFPGCTNDRRAVTRSVPASQPNIHITGVAPGNYAVAVIHDENSNGKLDTFAGMPREGFGFSRNPRIGFGPPRFAAAEFAVGTVTQTQQVMMRYML